MGDLIENLITLVLWIVASYYLHPSAIKLSLSRSPKSRAPWPRNLVEPRDPLEESARRKPKYPSSLDDLSEAEFQLWESRLLQFAEESGMLEDEDGWEVPWSGYRYYDFDELFELYVHREGKPLIPPAKLVLVEGRRVSSFRSWCRMMRSQSLRRRLRKPRFLDPLPLAEHRLQKKRLNPKRRPRHR